MIHQRMVRNILQMSNEKLHKELTTARHLYAAGASDRHSELWYGALIRENNRRGVT